MNSREFLDIGQSGRQERTKDTLEVGFCFCGIPAGIQEKDLVRAVALDRPDPKPFQNLTLTSKPRRGRQGNQDFLK